MKISLLSHNIRLTMKTEQYHFCTCKHQLLLTPKLKSPAWHKLQIPMFSSHKTCSSVFVMRFLVLWIALPPLTMLWLNTVTQNQLFRVNHSFLFLFQKDYTHKRQVKVQSKYAFSEPALIPQDNSRSSRDFQWKAVRQQSYSCLNMVKSIARNRRKSWFLKTKASNCPHVRAIFWF